MNFAAARACLLLTITGGLVPAADFFTPPPFQAPLIRAYPLRDYQEAMLLEAVRYMRLGFRRILLQLPTGGGKTIMAGAMLGSAQQLDLNSQFIVHRKELIDQTSKSFARAGLPHGYVAAGRPMDAAAAVLIAGVQTLANRLHLILPPNLIVLDEAHHATAATWAQVLEEFPDAFIIGLTATPERLDGRGLDDHFDVMIRGPSTAELIARGFLSPFDYFAPGVPDLAGVKTTAGDFNRGALAAAMDKPKLVGDAVEHYLNLAAGQQGIHFASSREHSRHLADAFGAAGVRAAHVDGSMSDKERDRIVDSFRDGALDIMTNVDLFGEGFDVPGLVYCGLSRPTKSLALHLQQVGRALRVIEGRTKTAVICDHAGNWFTHGLPDSEREWSLEGRAARARGCNDDAAPVRQCLTCYRVSPSTVRVCPGCGTEFPVQERRLQTVDGTLTKIERDEIRKREQHRRRAEEQSCRSQADFERLGEARGYEFPKQWAKKQIAGRVAAAARFRRR